MGTHVAHRVPEARKDEVARFDVHVGLAVAEGNRVCRRDGAEQQRRRGNQPYIHLIISVSPQ